MLRWLLPLAALAACSSRPGPAGPDDPVPESAPYHAECFIGPEHCGLEGDFDGDGRADRVRTVRQKGGDRGALEFRFANGDVVLLGLREETWLRLDEDEEDKMPGTSWIDEPIPEDFAFLTRWDVRPAYRVDPPIPGLRGDALFLDGGDSAVLVWRAEDRWRVSYLGY
jgi:hypothetical protein